MSGQRPVNWVRIEDAEREGFALVTKLNLEDLFLSSGLLRNKYIVERQAFGSASVRSHNLIMRGRVPFGSVAERKRYTRVMRSLPYFPLTTTGRPGIGDLSTGTLRGSRPECTTSCYPSLS